MSQRRPATIAARQGIDTDNQHGAVVPPIYLSTNYTFEGYDQKREYDYARRGNPTRSQLAAALADLEAGAGAVVTSSGLAAITLITALLNADDTILIPHDCYGGSYRLFMSLADQGKFKVAVVDQNDADALEQALAAKPKIVLLETPSNPLLRLVDVELLASKAKAAGALVVADNTFLSPCLQQPLTQGADLVLHSTTKYINGHSDVVGGVVIAKEKQMAEDLIWWANCLGLTGGAFDSWLSLRGLRTLPLRIAQHQTNAQAVAQLLAAHPAVEKVYYPGLTSHPQHELAKRQQKGFGGMLSFELKGGVEEVRAFLFRLQLFVLAESLGGVESLVAHPATMTHAGMDEDARKVAGISDSLIRLSVGIEDTQDLLADLRHALG